MAQRILVVDDEPVIVDAAGKILRAEGFEVRTAGDAEGGLALLHSEPFDIALIDLMLPGISGMGLLHFIRGERAATAVIMMTGYSTVENAVAFLKEGALDFLPKPFTFEELLSPVLRAGRYLALCATKSAVRPADGSYRLGIGSWARAEADGTVLLGVTDTFTQIAGPIVEFELPKIEAQVVQGGVLAHALAQDGLRHTAWSPLGGRVTGVNQAAAENLKSAAPDPQGAGWLLKIVPSRFDRELVNLS